MANYLKKTLIIDKNSTLNQFIRYAIVGGLASIVDISIFNIGVNFLSLNHIASNTISFIFGLMVNYVLSREWVFNKKAHNVKRDFMLFSLIGVTGLLISNILLFVFIDYKILYWLLSSSNDSIVKPLAKLMTVALVLLWNFFARKKIVFKDQQ